MFRFAYVALASCVCLLSAPASAEDPDVDTVIAGIESTYKDVTSLRADFVQVTRSMAMGEQTRQRGKVQLLRPKKMRWAFTNPPGKLFVTDGETMWIWSKSDNQVIVSKGMGQGSGSMSQLLEDLDKIGSLFDVELLDGTKSTEKRSYVLSLKPKEIAGASFQKIELTLSKKKYTVEKVLMTDAFDNEVELSFSQVRTNVQLDDSAFRFEVPPGAQVIRADGP